MGEVLRLPEQRREFIADADRSALRATWHRESGFVVLSLWRGETCVATSHITPQEAGRLAAFITSGLADLATEMHAGDQTIKHAVPAVPFSLRFRASLRRWRESIARSLESIVRRLRG